MRRRVLIALLVMAGLLAGTALWVRNYLASPLTIPAEGYRLEIAPGTPWSAVARRLADDGITAWAPVLRACGQLTGQAGRIQAGEYDLVPGMTPGTLLHQLVAGRVVLHKFTLVEGWTVGDILHAIVGEPALEKTLHAIQSPDVAGGVAGELAIELDLPWPSAEGAFLPETYLFARGTTDRAMLVRANAALNERLNAAWKMRRPDLPLSSPYELLILASIVERETALAGERPLIAGVFIRRLEKRMRLQTDPTVIYGLGPGFDGNLTRVNLETDSPWNTYTRDGLPPTPIAAPSGEAIDAASRPAEGKSLFFVASGKGDGSHRFTDTLEDHEAAVRDYLATLKKSNGN
jgi:UPF0755 protein